MRKKLSERQLQIMNILWNHGESMIASDILKENEELNTNTVQASLRSLLKKEYIKVDDIVYSGRVLTRSYRPIVSREEYLDEAYNEMSDLLNSETLMAALIEHTKDESELNELEELIKKRRMQLKR